jgi:hypothetical protein
MQSWQPRPLRRATMCIVARPMLALLLLLALAGAAAETVMVAEQPAAGQLSLLEALRRPDVTSIALASDVNAAAATQGLPEPIPIDRSGGRHAGCSAAARSQAAVPRPPRAPWPLLTPKHLPPSPSPSRLTPRNPLPFPFPPPHQEHHHHNRGPLGPQGTRPGLRPQPPRALRQLHADAALCSGRQRPQGQRCLGRLHPGPGRGPQRGLATRRAPRHSAPTHGMRRRGRWRRAGADVRAAAGHGGRADGAHSRPHIQGESLPVELHGQ